MREIQVGDWVVVTIKREDYYGLEGRVVEFPLWFHNNGPISYFAVVLADNFTPTRLAQMPFAGAHWPNGMSADIYFFTRSQIEPLVWNSHAIEVLGEDYFD